MFKVYQAHKCRLGPAVLSILHLHAILHIVHQLFVALFQQALVDVGHLAERLMQHVVVPLWVMPADIRHEVGSMVGFAIVALHVVATLILVAHLLEQSYQRLFVLLFFEFRIHIS